MTKRLPKWLLAALSAWLLAAPFSAAGSEYDADRLLADAAAKREQLISLEAVYEFKTVSTGSPGRVRQTVFFRAPDRIRLNLSWPDREEVFLASNLSTLVMVGDQATDTPWPQPFLLYRLLLESDPERMRKLLSSFGFDLKRIDVTPDGRLVILGAEYGDSRSPQVWFDGGSLNLTRLILPLNAEHPEYDILLDDYARHDPGVMWPHRIIVKQGPFPSGRRVLTLRSFGVNVGAQQEPFDLKALRRTVAPPPEEPTAADPPDLVEIRKMLKWLNKKLELSKTNP